MNSLKHTNTVLINIIIASIIPFLIWGPFFPDLIVSVSVLFFLYYVFKNKNFYYLLNKPIIIFFIFCIYCILISIFRAKDMMLSFESSLFYFRIGVFSCFIWYLIDKDKNILTYFYYTLILCFSVLVIDGYFQYFNGENLLGFKIIGSSSARISSFFKDELILGSYLSRLFPLLFALFLVKKKKRFEIYFIGLLFILVDILIFMSGERTAFFFLNLSTVFIIILIKEYQIFRLITFMIAITFIFGLSINSSKLSDRMFKVPLKNMGFFQSANEPIVNSETNKSIVNSETNKSIVNSETNKSIVNSESNKPVIFTPIHDSLIRTAYNMYKDQPIVGHGPKMFRVMCKDKKYAEGKTSCMTHPHNFYVQLLAETGIIGFLFLFSALIYVLYASFKQFKSLIFKQKRPFTDYQVCLLAGILITVWPFTPNGNFFNNWLMITYSFPIGFYLQSVYSKKMIKKDF